MKKPIFKAKRGVLAVLCLVPILAVVLMLPSFGAATYASLPNIEGTVARLRASRERFQILEIADDGGCFGYYVAGQEPTADWRQALAAQPTRAARQAYMDNLYAQVRDFSAPDATSAPLTWTAYREAAPWQAHTNMNSLSLSAPQTEMVPGRLSAGSGPYRAIWQYTLHNPGDYVQDIRYFAAGITPAADVYYYAPTFQLLDTIGADGLTEIPANAAIYCLAADGVTYLYEGTMGDGLSLDMDIAHYRITATGAPSATPVGAQIYAAIPNTATYPDGFQPTPAGTTGYFNREKTGYLHVGGTDGDYAFSYQEGAAEQYPITYHTVYYTGGYSNNQWFLKYVLDRSGDAADLAGLNVRVQTVQPQALTPELIDAAACILLTAKGGSLSEACARSLYNRGSMDSKTPILIDYRVTEAPDATLRATAQLILTKSQNSAGYHRVSEAEFAQLRSKLSWSELPDREFVSGNILCTYPNPGRFPALVSKAFNTEYTDPIGFAPIKAELTHENFLRTQQGLSGEQLLPIKASLATSLRYILNFGGQRGIGTKDKIRVLEIQPGRGTSLTTAQVKAWLGLKADDPSMAVTIVSMSTAELVGKIENLNETYDMIYIGSDPTGFSTKKDGRGQTITDYNDNSMDGMLYTNIGDTYTSDLRMSGLLARDYTTGTFRDPNNPSGPLYPYLDARAGAKSNTFRFSGNDLTASKAQELRDFANAGYPVILENDLLSSKALDDRRSFRLSVTQAGGTLTATPTTDDGQPLPSYDQYAIDWYTGNQSWVGWGFSYTPKDKGSYYCELRIPGDDDAGAPARSDTWICTQDGSAPIRLTTTVIKADTAAEIAPGKSISRGTRLQFSAAATPVSGVTYTNSWQVFTDGWGWTATDGTYWTESLNYGQTRRFRCMVQISAPPGVIVAQNTLFTPEIVFSRKNQRTVQYQLRTDNTVFHETTVSTKATLEPVANTARPGSFLQRGSGSALPAISTALVDNSSNLYAALRDIDGKANVMSAKAAAADAATVLRYLNLSKPELRLTAVPQKYEMRSSGATALDRAADGNYYLNYAFTIANKTDATPASTTYDCRLYLDLNADGKYSDGEQISDVVIKTAAGRLLAPAKGVYALSADTAYTLSRQMPSDYAGFLSWKLEVIKNDGGFNIHASQHGYTRIAPAVRKPLRILQINSSRSGDSYDRTINLQQQQQPTATKTGNCYSHTAGTGYAGIYGKLLADAEDFDVQITTIRTWQLDKQLPGEFANIPAYLNAFDMLIIGFDDMYQELSSNAANAIVGYIDTGKSVLFTHDTTSQANLPFSDYQKQGDRGVQSVGFGGNLALWGVEFNRLLRDPVSLDRYGIRSQQAALQALLYRQNDGSDLSPSEIAALSDNHYSIAYQPGSGRRQTVPETQGYTNYALCRYGAAGQRSFLSPNYDGDNTRSTDYVSQLNEGQLTTYPYDVNTAAFKNSNSGNSYMNVGTTHEQYYQINLNSDDVVVWYCLANSNGSAATPGYYSNLPNDATNAYYIYSKGNVTYSGAGHYDGGTRYLADRAGNVGDAYVNEAKLFVNTMIAAYRTGREQTGVHFTASKSGDGNQDYIFLTTDATAASAEHDMLLSAAAGDAQATTAYFKISDPTLGGGKNISATLSYCTKLTTQAGESASVPMTSLPLYYADNPAQAADLGSLSAGPVYAFRLPEAVLQTLQKSEVAYVKVRISVTTTINGVAASAPAEDVLELRKINLFPLR